jgi:hypothetical protein
MALAPGTINGVISTTNDQTDQQRKALTDLNNASTGFIPSSYAGTILLPDGTLSKDYSVLSKPTDRIAEINAVLAAGSDPAKPSGGYIIQVNDAGIPVQYIPIGPPPNLSAPVVPFVPVNSVSSTAQPSIVPGAPVKLAEVVKLSAGQVTRQYVKGTMQAIERQTITATNTTNNVSVQVSFTPQIGLTFEPTAFLLAPNSSQNTVLSFELGAIDALPEGLTTYNIPVTLTSPTAIFPVAISPTATPTPVPVVSTPPVITIPIVDTPPTTFIPSDPLPPGRWTLREVSPATADTQTIVTFKTDLNGEAPQELNNYVGGYYNTTYGYHKTTVTGPVYDYVLVGDGKSAGIKPIPPATNVTITEDDNKNQVLSNVFVISFEDYGAKLNQPKPLLPAPPAPENPPTQTASTPLVTGGSGGGSSVGTTGPRARLTELSLE